jgi:hypothetical protein
MPRKKLLVGVLAALSFAACASTPSESSVERGSLPVLHPFDPARAESGHNWLTVDTVSEPVVPRVGIENLWVVWPGGLNGDYWTSFRKRYGLHEAPFDNDGLPMGIRAKGEYVTFDCLLCHGGVVAGQPTIGVANSMLDVQGLLDDLEAAAKLAGLKAPLQLRNRTGAAGATDAVGMAFAFGEQLYGVPPGTLNKDVGFERAPAWWQLKYKRHAFNDGSAESPGFRTMAGTLLAFGLSLDQIAARGDEFVDIGNYILSLEPPAWRGPAIDETRWAKGRDLYETNCSSCHGTYHTSPHASTTSFPDVIEPVDSVGTDPDRTLLFRQQEADAINSTWLGDPPLTNTDGYLAPTLLGIWARAPYLHNGSVPDLVSLLDSKSRPARWQRTGSGEADFDFDRVGWRYDTPADGGDPTTIEGRRIYDTSRAGLHNTGHTYGDALTADERAAVVEYLKSL